jgi:hypothetical protein
MEILMDFDDTALAVLNEIQAQTQMDHPTILSHSLGMIRWILKQRRDNRIVASLSESEHTYRELDLDAIFAQPQASEVLGGKKGKAA